MAFPAAAFLDEPDRRIHGYRAKDDHAIEYLPEHHRDGGCGDQQEHDRVVDLAQEHRGVTRPVPTRESVGAVPLSARDNFSVGESPVR